MSNPAPHDQMARMLVGTWTSQMLYVAAKLEIADALTGGPKSAAELASATGTNEDALYRLLRALASLGVFAEEESSPRTFRLTPLAECLRRDVPDSRWAIAVMFGEEHFGCWGDLLESIRTGETAFPKRYGAPIFEYLPQHPEKAKLFDAAMTSFHGPETAAMLDAYDLSDVSVLADIGGGNGSTLIGILNRYPQLQGILFDLPGVVERARADIESAGLADRCQVVGGSFFESVPAGADAYMMRHIIHDWYDDRAVPILQTIRKAIGANKARLLVVEHVLEAGNTHDFGKLLDLNMLLLPGGQERTEAEFRQIYSEAGFELTRIVPTASAVSVVEGRPV